MSNQTHNQHNRRHFIKSAGLAAVGGAMLATTGTTLAKSAAEAAAGAKTLAGKVAFITGAARGIGRAIAETYAKQGADVVMIDIADPSKLNSTDGYRVATMTEFNSAVSAVQKHGRRVQKVQADVRDLQALQAAADVAADSLGGIDIVVTCAGYVAWHAFADGTEQQWQDVVDVNVHGVFKTIKAAIPHLQARGGGSIINFASIGGRAGFAGNGAYTSTKWAVIGMTKQAALELGAANITVNAISPGPVNTPMYRSEGQLRSMGITTPEQQDALINPMLPLGDRPALEPQEIADVALFLASDAARSISGAAIDVALGFNANYTA